MRLIFVGGCERSGTSLVQKLLLSHSRVAGGPELLFTGRIAALWSRMAAPYPRPWADRIAAFYGPDDLAGAFRELFMQLLRPLVEGRPGALWLSEKTPSNVFAAPDLLRLFPDSRFVHVVRDGRDVVASHREVRRRLVAAEESAVAGSFSIPRIAVRWNRAAEMDALLAGREELAERTSRIRFEELVQEPRRVVGDLFADLGLEPEDRTLSPESFSAPSVGLPLDGIWTTADRDARGFDPSRVGIWRRALPGPARGLCQLLMAGQLRRFGYPVAAGWVAGHQALRRLGVPL